MENLVVLIIVVTLFLLSGLLTFLRNPSHGLYKDPLDDSFLDYFQSGKDYTMLEFIQEVDKETEGLVKLPEKKTKNWLDDCVQSKKLTIKTRTQETKKGRYRVVVYSLTRGQP